MSGGPWKGGWDPWDRSDEAPDYGRATGRNSPECGLCGADFQPIERGQTTCDACIAQVSLRRAPQAPTPLEHEVAGGGRAEAVAAGDRAMQIDAPTPRPDEHQRGRPGLDVERQPELYPGVDVRPRALRRRELHGGAAMDVPAGANQAAALRLDGRAGGVEVDVEPVTDAFERERPADVGVGIEEERAGGLPPLAALRVPAAPVHAEVAEGLVDDGDFEHVERGELATEEGGAGVEGVGGIAADAEGAGEEAALLAAAARRNQSASEPAAPHESRIACRAAGFHAVQVRGTTALEEDDHDDAS